VRERFGGGTVFEREIGGMKYKCAIRGGDEAKKPIIRVINYPDGVDNEEIRKSVNEFAKVTSEIRCERHTKRDGEFLSGIPNGNLVMEAELIGRVPRTIEIEQRKVRIVVLDGKKRCYKCNSEDHIAAVCGLEESPGTDEDSVAESEEDEEEIKNDEEEEIQDRVEDRQGAETERNESVKIGKKTNKGMPIGRLTRAQKLSVTDKEGKTSQTRISSLSTKKQ